METEQVVIDQEEERLKLADQLGLTNQRKFAREELDWQMIQKRDWKRFATGEALAQYLFEKHKLFYSGWGIFKHSDYWKMLDFVHLIRAYPQRLPMGVILKYQDALSTKIFGTFQVIDPDIKSMKVDPFLIASDSGLRSDQECTLICSWEDKSK